MRRRRRALFAVAALFGSLAACLAAVELVLAYVRPEIRFESWHRASYSYLLDDDVDWKLEPGKYDWGTVNAAHFRGSPVPQDPTPGRLRIVVLGGSAAFDLGQPDDGTWAVRLERRLAASLGVDVEVLNCATPGYSSWQCRRLLETRILDWKPDLVLLYELFNDSLAFRYCDAGEIRQGWKLNAAANHIGAVAHPCRAFDACAAVLPRLADGARMALLERARSRTASRNIAFWCDFSLQSAVCPGGLEFFRANRAAIAESLAQAGGVPLVLVSQATLIRPDNTPEERDVILYEFRGLSHERLVEAYRQAREIDRELADEHANVFVLPAHEHVPATREFFADEVHFTPAGSERLAEYVARELVDRGLVKRARR